MIDAKQAVQIAKNSAADMLGQFNTKLEEIEKGSFRDRETWNITLSFARDLNSMEPLARLGIDPIEYKRFLVDAETGELVALRLREPASR